MSHPKQFLIDGIDRLGKSSLVQNIQNRLGYHLLVHSSKPVDLDFYIGRFAKSPKELYQRDCNTNMFQLMASGAKLIFDRTHLGEMVYAPLYRDYDGSYVYQNETPENTQHARLVLLITSNFDMLEDDGESFNWDNKVKEQQMFINAFLRSSIKDKVMVDVHNGKGEYKSFRAILDEVLKST